MSGHMHITKHCYITPSSEFAFKNTSASIFYRDKLALLRLTIFPASENTRSEGADVAGIARMPDIYESRRISGVQTGKGNRN